MTELLEFMELIESIFNRPVGILLIITGLFFLLIAVLFKLTAIESKIANIIAVVMGAMLTITGIITHLNPPTYPKSSSTFTDNEPVIPKNSSTQTQPGSENLSAKQSDLKKSDASLIKASLDYMPVTQFEFIWNNRQIETRQKQITLYRPVPPAGYKIFGYYAQENYQKPVGQVIAVKMLSSDKDVLVYPADFKRIWYDTDLDGAIWRPIPPPGYLCLGDIATHASEKPDRKEIVCVRDDLTAKGKSDKLLWDSKEINANQDIRLYSVQAEDPAEGFFLNLFQGYVRSLSKSGYSSLPVLKNEWLMMKNG